MSKPPFDSLLSILDDLRETPPLFYETTTLPAGVFLTIEQAELIIPVLLKHFPAKKVQELFGHVLPENAKIYLEMPNQERSKRTFHRHFLAGFLFPKRFMTLKRIR